VRIQIFTVDTKCAAMILIRNCLSETKNPQEKPIILSVILPV